MKKNYILIALLTAFNFAFAQIPSGYYDSATGTGYALKTQLKEIIDDSNDGLATEFLAQDLGYGELYDTFELSDVDIYYDHSGPIPATNKPLLDMYSERPTSADAYEYIYGSAQQDDGSLGTAEGQRFNREHTIPQSVFAGLSPMKNDAHFVIPCDKYLNAQRGVFPYGIVDISGGAATYDEYSNTSKRGPNLNSGISAGYSGTVYEPIDEFKGDIARLYFFFVTRYEDDLVSFSNTNGTYEMFDGSANQAFNQTFLNIMYQWHVQDPVSQKELDRNNAIYGRQSNRNPYIDNPNYVFEIWQSVLSVDQFSLQENTVTFYPNPVTENVLHVKSNVNLDVTVFNVLGQNVLTTKTTSTNNTINVSTLNTGVYIVKLKSKNGTITKKLIKE